MTYSLGRYFKLTLALIMLFFVKGSYAQIKINSFGKFFMGSEPVNHDLDNILSGSIFGPSSYTYREGSKLAFGDFGKLSTGGWNVFIGERQSYNSSTNTWTDSDSDQLWLHGKLGIYLSTNGNAANPVAYCVGNVPSEFVFNCNVKAVNFVTLSDEKYKSNIKRIGSAMSLIKKINGVTYNMKQNPYAQATKVTSTDKLSDKEKKCQLEGLAFNNQLVKRYGVTAQNIQKVLPELVSQDSLGLSVNYISLIPVIIEALKEQDSLITLQNQKINQLQNLINKNLGSGNSKGRIADTTSRTTISDSTKLSGSTPKLFQNVPNPFTNETAIACFIPLNTNESKLWILNLQGLLLKEIKITSKGNSQVNINSNELKPGIYYYSLIVDGNEVDSKKMIVN